MVEEGASVNAGDPLIVMIAMKMEYVIKVSWPGQIVYVLFGLIVPTKYVICKLSWVDLFFNVHFVMIVITMPMD